MRRLFLQGVLSNEVTVTGSDAHHLGYALRAKEGDRVIAADRDGKTAVMEITGFTSDTVTLKLIEEI
ncbi:MAG: RNA methyltransferase, partial [Schwartzia sp.]|nr:RNA methyltransferase [Schwartzia sp. (in: firmicutes)]